MTELETIIMLPGQVLAMTKLEFTVHANFKNVSFIKLTPEDEH